MKEDGSSGGYSMNVAGPSSLIGSIAVPTRLGLSINCCQFSSNLQIL